MGFQNINKSNKAIRQIKPVLDGILENGKWNFDLTNCDKILPVDTDKNITTKIITALFLQGFICEELQ